MPSTGQAGGAPASDPQVALHFAALAVGLAEAREQQGRPFADQERAHYDRYQDAARAHGFTDEHIRDCLNALRPSLALPRPTV